MQLQTLTTARLWSYHAYDYAITLYKLCPICNLDAVPTQASVGLIIVYMKVQVTKTQTDQVLDKVHVRL